MNIIGGNIIIKTQWRRFMNNFILKSEFRVCQNKSRNNNGLNLFAFMQYSTFFKL